MTSVPGTTENRTGRDSSQVTAGRSRETRGARLWEHDLNDAPSSWPADRDAQRRSVPRHVDQNNDHRDDRDRAKPRHADDPLSSNRGGKREGLDLSPNRPNRVLAGEVGRNDPASGGVERRLGLRRPTARHSLHLRISAPCPLGRSSSAVRSGHLAVATDHTATRCS